MSAPVRVLQVVGGLDVGGTETWLLHVLRKMDRSAVRMDFLVHRDAPGAYDLEFQELGSRVHVCPDPDKPWRYARRFFQILREHGPYDVVHSHVHHYSGFVLWLAALAGIPSRVAHSHSDTRSEPRSTRLARRLYLKATEALVRRYATRELAASAAAASALFGENWRSDPRASIAYCGLDLEPFRRSYDRAATRAELGIPQDALVVGHVGRFVPVKNHDFLIQIIAELAAIEPRTHALLVGDGPLRPAIQERVREMGLKDRVTFTGLRRDVPRLMRVAMDLLVFPSHFEGLPLTIVEAQAAGLPVALSDAVSRECQETDALSWLSLSLTAADWANRSRELLLKDRPTPPPTSRFDAQHSAARLEVVYR